MPVSAVRQIVFNARVDITDRVAAITAPTQLVTGRHDQMVPMKLQQHLAEAIPHAKQTILPTAHAMPFDQPDLFIKLLTDFLAETEPNR
jgi:pimeloyl-ACP methyl ester carboxylesterase